MDVDFLSICTGPAVQKGRAVKAADVSFFCIFVNPAIKKRRGVKAVGVDFLCICVGPAIKKRRGERMSTFSAYVSALPFKRDGPSRQLVSGFFLHMC